MIVLITMAFGGVESRMLSCAWRRSGCHNTYLLRAWHMNANAEFSMPRIGVEGRKQQTRVCQRKMEEIIRMRIHVLDGMQRSFQYFVAIMEGVSFF